MVFLLYAEFSEISTVFSKSLRQLNALQEIAAHHPFFVFQRHNGLEFPGDGLYFGFAEEMEETGSSLDRSGHVGFDLHLVGFVGYGCGDAAHGDAGDSGVGVAVQVGIAELLVLFFGGFCCTAVSAENSFFDGAEGFFRRLRL